VFQNLKKHIRSKKILQDQRRFEEEFYKKAVLSYPPRSVTLTITSYCNNKCIFCAYHSDDAKEVSNVYGLHFKLSLDDFKRIINMCYQGRVPHVHICATGEPFIHKQILEMIDYCIEVYGTSSIQTNFYRPIFEKNNYYDAIIKRADAISYITTDVLSGDENQHNELKKGSTYKDVMHAMEYINSKCNVKFKVHLVLTRYNYMHINDLITDIADKKINADLEIVNLHPHCFNEFTSFEAPYMSSDLAIKDALESAAKYALQKNITIAIPKPFDDNTDSKCSSFWTRFQLWPVKGNDINRYHENVIMGACNAVVRGSISTLGYIFDYKNIMDLWNNEYFVKYRTMLLNGEYPDSECVHCQSYNAGKP